MKTLLIVEDEKMIRQGIRTMVQRSGVPVEVILECSNGEQALEILKDKDVEVMFTDIRMPKMDGIELVAEVQKLENKPQVVAISGYDDFAYAVEMLRNGVREYLLKPVERDKIKEILQKLDEELKDNKKKFETEERLGISQIKALLTKQEIDENELKPMIDKYEKYFFTDGYGLCVFPKKMEPIKREGVLFVEGLNDCAICFVDSKYYPHFKKNDIGESYAGCSEIHKGIREIKLAFEEAYRVRKVAFYAKKAFLSPSDAMPRIPESLIKSASLQIEEKAFTKRLHLIGTDKTEELTESWGKLFEELKKSRINASDYENANLKFIDDVETIYKNIIDEATLEKLNSLKLIYQYDNIDDYQENFLEVILSIHDAINDKSDIGKNQAKILKAIDYIKKNYNKELNMAIVSNEISMNYSLFSYDFKQLTGKNFVTYLRDIRIEEAKKLLKDTDMKIIDISLAVGYDNEKHFMKVFKQVCGVSPSEYRKNVTS